MDITPTIPKNQNFINSYGFNGFEINEAFYKNTLILTPQKILEIKINSIDDFFNQDWQSIFDIIPEILLIGTGTKHLAISGDLKNKIKQKYPSVSISEMSTSSACRTYNILMMEDRNVATLLMQII